MMYLLLKALHVATVIAWIGGLLLQSLALKSASYPGAAAAGHAGFLQQVQRWDRRVTSPAMGVAWLAGIAMALEGGWFASGWLNAKLVLVVGLSALHGLQAGRLRRLDPPETVKSGYPGRTPLMILVVIFAIACLVILKPFS